MAAFSGAMSQITFEKTYSLGGGELAHSVRPVSTGGYLSCGYTNVAGTYDAHLTRLDATGSVLWSKQYGSSNSEDLFAAVETPGGNFIAVGYTYGINGDLYVINTDAGGNIIWSKTFDIGPNEYGYAIARTTDSKYVIVGSTYTGTDNDIYFLKIDSLGNLLWSKQFNNGVGNSYEIGFDLKQTSDGGYAIAGYTDGSGAGLFDVYVIKTDSSGNIQWDRTYGGSNNEFGGYSISETAGGGYIIGGSTSTFGAGNGDYYLVRADATGNILWSKTFGGSATEYGYSCRQTVDGGFVLTGFTNSFGSGMNDAYLVKTDSAGSLQWSRTYGTVSDELASWVMQTPDNGFIITGYPYNFGPPLTDIHIIKTDPLGNIGTACQLTPVTIVTTPPSVTGNPNTISVAHTTLVNNYTCPVAIPVISDSTRCISCIPPTLSISSTPVSCTVNNGTATVTTTGGNPPYTYVWTPGGQTTQTATGLGPGTYTVTVTEGGGCSQTTTITIAPASSPVLTLTSQTNVLCNGDVNGSAVMSTTGGTSPYSYSWAPSGGTNATATGFGAGTYTCTVTDANGCIVTLTVTITEPPAVLAAISATPLIINPGDNTQLIASGGTTYQWSPQTGLSCDTCSNPLASPSVTTTYCVRVSDANGCPDSTCITITVEIPCGDIFVPNAFSPNNDGANEMQCVMGNCVRTLYFTIYDRWGERVFETTDKTQCWDGAYKGKLLNTAVFVYYLEATLLSGEQVNKQGNISLIR